MLSRKHNASNDMRERIILNAEKVFAQKGYAAASIRELCEATGVNRALIYYYFVDKADLYRAVIAHGDALLLQIAREAQAYSGSALEKIHIFLSRSAQLHIERPSMMEMLIRSERDHDHPDGLLPLPQRLPEPPMILKQILTEGVAAGDIRPLNLDTLLHLLIGMIHSLVMMQIKSQSTTVSDSSVEQVLSILAHGIAVSR